MRLDIVVPDWAERLASDLTDMNRSAVAVAPGDVVTYDLPDDVYFEYAFGDSAGKLRPDPAVATRATSIWYGEVTAVHGPAYRPDTLTTSVGRVLGTTDRLRLESAVLDGQTRRLSVYTPAGAATSGESPLPLVVVQDGVAAYRTGRLHEVAQALIDRGEARPARFAFVEPIDRRVEYSFDEGYQEFLQAELLPFLAQSYAHDGEVVWVGFSLGALASAQAALRGSAARGTLTGPATSRHGASHTVVAFSGAFKGDPQDPDPYSAGRSWLVKRINDLGGALPPRWYLEVGTLEWLLAVNRQVATALVAGGANVVLRERNAGHNWTNWRNGLADALRFALRP